MVVMLGCRDLANVTFAMRTAVFAYEIVICWEIWAKEGANLPQNQTSYLSESGSMLFCPHFPPNNGTVIQFDGCKVDDQC